jgi:hypothetical protein
MGTVGVGAADEARLTLARAVVVLTRVVAGVIVAGILLVVLDANPRNDVVQFVTDVAETLVGPFKNLFTPDDGDLRVALNWGIAAGVYWFAGRFIARLLAR